MVDGGGGEAWRGAYWCTWLVAATSKWRFFAAQNSDNEKLEKAVRNELRLAVALRMAPVPSKTTGQNLTTHWAGPTEVALQTLLGAAHTPASDRQGLYITVLTYTRDTLSGRHALRPTIDVPTRSGTPNAPRDTCARPRVHTHNGRKPARVHQRGPN